MRYLHVHWSHTSADDPVDLYSEIDDDSWEVRKVEIFRDGSMGFADATVAAGSTELGLEPFPTVEVIARNPQFQPKEISRADFERSWNSAHLSSSVKAR